MINLAIVFESFGSITTHSNGGTIARVYLCTSLVHNDTKDGWRHQVFGREEKVCNRSFIIFICKVSNCFNCLPSFDE